MLARYRNNTDITRREFLGKGSRALVVSSLAGCSRVSEIEQAPLYRLSELFPVYDRFDPIVPVWCVTPNLSGAMHRFHHSSPFSPSGQYLALTRLPFEDRRPKPGEGADILVVDLKDGNTVIVGRTRGWDTQVGAHVQWGVRDEELYFNDLDTETWKAFGVRMDIFSGAARKLDGEIYDVSPDGLWAASTSLARLPRTQPGYGVVVPAEHIRINKGAVDDDGVYVTDLSTGTSRMIASYQKIAREAVPAIDVKRYGPGDFYGFHVKWNATSERLLLVLRYKPEGGARHKSQLLSMKADGSDIRVAVPASKWADKGGNHPNWCPDGEHLMMNLNYQGEGLRFVRVRYDGEGLAPITDVPASRGHPSLHPDGKHIITDAYPNEEVSFGDGSAPLWLIDIDKGKRTTLARINAVTRAFRESGGRKAKDLRVDLHPAWDQKTHTHVAFNGVLGGTRKVFVADLSSLVESTA